MAKSLFVLLRVLPAPAEWWLPPNVSEKQATEKRLSLEGRPSVLNMEDNLWAFYKSRNNTHNIQTNLQLNLSWDESVTGRGTTATGLLSWSWFVAAADEF